jgi:hypothetical protein
MKIRTLITTLLLSGCLVTAPVMAGDDVASVIKAAKEALKKATSVGGEWRDTGKFIKKAEAAAKKGDAKKALKLAAKAKVQAEDGYIQATEQAKTATEFPDYLK